MEMRRGLRYWLIAAFIGHASAAGSAEDKNSIPPLSEAKSATTNVVTTIFDQIVMFSVPNGWKPAQQSANQAQYIIEFIPQDQTRQTWSEMITMQAFRGLAQNPRVTPRALLSVLADGIQKACGDQFLAQFLGDRKVDSFEAHAAVIGCGRLPSAVAGAKAGQSEIGLYVAIRGNNDAYVFQRAIRGAAFDKISPPISAANADESFLPLKDVKICVRSSPDGPCARQPGR